MPERVIIAYVIIAVMIVGGIFVLLQVRRARLAERALRRGHRPTRLR